MPNEELEILKKIHDKLEILAKAQLRPSFEHELKDKKHKQLYDLTGKKISVNELSKKTGVSAGKISMLWQKWESSGLLKKDGKFYKKIFE